MLTMRDLLTKGIGRKDNQNQDLRTLQHLPFIAASRSPSWIRDLLLLFFLPGVLMTVIFVTTEPRMFEYRVIDPTLWGIYTSNLAHRSWRHLLGNFGGLIIIGGLEYVVLTATGYRKHYFGIFLGSLVVFPVIGHLFLQVVLANNPVFRSYEAVGFSQPLAAMTGYLPLVITIYLSQARDSRLSVFLGIFLYAGGIAWAMGQIFGFDNTTFGMGLLSLVGAGWVGWYYYQTTTGERGRIAPTVLILVLIYGISLQSLFPGQNVGSMIGHLAGFLPGFFIPLTVICIFLFITPDRNQPVTLG